MFKYETHLHTFPVSRCATASVRESLELYKEMGYDGVFVTNHFLDGNINVDSSAPYEEKIEFYFSDYENALLIGKELGIKVFLGVEISYKGTDFLIYGLDKEWFLNNPQIMELDCRKKLEYYKEHGACIVQAHPFREAWYIDHLRLFPRNIDAVEVNNACRTQEENEMAKIYAEKYGLFGVAGTDNHIGKKQTVFSGIQTEKPLSNEQDYIRLIKNGKLEIFTHKREI